MEYIIFDLEWNQPYHTDLEYLKRTKMELTGEIIQIGAVKVDENLEVIDTFDMIVKPQFLSYIQHHVLELTGLSEEKIWNGQPFKQVIEKFKNWCGKDSLLLSWGSDDLLILLENLRVHHIADDCNDRWYDAQRIYGWQVNKNEKQVSVKNALIAQNIELDLPQHYALNDAIYTVKILDKINFPKCLESKKIQELAKSPLLVLPIPLDFSLIGKFKDKRHVFRTKRVIMSKCPSCNRELLKTSIEKTQGDKYMSLGECPVHGAFSIFWRVHKTSSKGQERQYFVTRSVSKTNKDINKWYYSKQERNRRRYETYMQKYYLRKTQNKGR